MVRILIVDDAVVMRTILKQTITANQFEVVAEASNGLEAVQLYALHKPDVVTMDITMPEMNGIEAVKRIRQLDPTAKIIMCSAMGQQHLVVDAIEAGAVDFIVKPIQSNRVISAIMNALSDK